MSPWITAARPKTLSAGVIPVVVASALALHDSKFIFFVFTSALLGATAIQIATNYINDASDFLRGADTEERLGPPRMAQSGVLSVRALFTGAAVFFLFAILFGIHLIFVAGIPLLFIGVFSIISAIAYTAGPYPLAYYGFGDLFVLIFFGFISVCGTYYAHTLSLGLEPFFCALMVGLFGVSLIIVNNARDIPTDIKANKKTLAVRLGLATTKNYYSTVVVLPYLILLLFYFLFSWSPLILTPLVSLPMAVKNIYRMRQARGSDQYNSLLGDSAKLQVLFGILLSSALILA